MKTRSETRRTPAGADARRLPSTIDDQAFEHIFDEDSIDAVNFALDVGRPLLVRGEPGIGKSQLARAVARALGWEFRAHVVDAHTEVRDLLYEVDSVRRLGDAHVHGAATDAAQRLALENYLKPGLLWFAFDWAGATRLAQGLAPNAEVTSPPGVVVLIDEIDKADAAVPNALLGPLAELSFVTASGDTVRASPSARPLVVFSTNEDRALSDAFVRRCVVLRLVFPGEEPEARAMLDRLAALHCPNTTRTLREEAATLLLLGREAAREADVAAPGYAEYVDLLKAVDAAPEGTDPAVLLRRLRRFVFYKHTEPPAKGKDPAAP